MHRSWELEELKIYTIVKEAGAWQDKLVPYTRFSSINLRGFSVLLIIHASNFVFQIWFNRRRKNMLCCVFVHKIVGLKSIIIYAKNRMHKTSDRITNWTSSQLCANRESYKQTLAAKVDSQEIVNNAKGWFDC